MLQNEIQTEHLILRPANNEEDLAAFRGALNTEDFHLLLPELSVLLCCEPDEKYCEYKQEHIEDDYFTKNGALYFAICLRESRNYIGHIGLDTMGNQKDRGCIEFYLLPKYRSKGYCQEAIRAMIASFQAGEITGVNGVRLFAEADRINETSIHILHKLGFEIYAEGVFLAEVFVGRVVSGEPEYDSVIVDQYKLELGEDSES